MPKPLNFLKNCRKGEKNLAVYTISRNFAANTLTMQLNYRHIIAATLLLTATHAASAAEPAFVNAYDPWLIEAPTPEVEAINVDEITIKAEGRKIHVNGAEGETLEVYNVAGVKVASFSIDAPEKTITLNVTRGVYILHVGKVARKVNIL